MHYAEILLALLLIFIAASLLTAWAWRWLRTSVYLSVGPARQSKQIFFVALIAPLVALWSVFFLYSPDLGAWALIDHCHQGECAPHPPRTLFSLFSIGLITIALMLFAVVFAGLFLHIKHQIKRSQILSMLATKTHGEIFYLLDSPQRFALCSGFLQPRILLSRGLYEMLSAEELEVVVSHEYAHAQAQDNLRKLLLFCATIFWPKKLRASLMDTFEFRCEQACDLAAARRHGPEAVANTLSRLMHLAANDIEKNSPALQVDSQRLLTLAAPNQAMVKPGTWALLLGLVVVEIPLLSSAFHLLAEIM